MSNNLSKQYDDITGKILALESNPKVAEYVALLEQREEIAKALRDRAVEIGEAIRTAKYIFTIFKRKTTDWKALFSYLVEKKRVEEKEILAFTEEKTVARVQEIKDETLAFSV